MTAFVIGNGKSREQIDLEQLGGIGAIYGCNALYRTFTPTVLVSTDKPISHAIQNSGYSKSNRFYTRRPLPNLGGIPVPPVYFGFSSGPIAMALAAMDGETNVYMIGFDMGPSISGKFNNVFADTEFYKTSTSTPTYTGNWIKQMVTVAKDFRQTRFIRVHGSLTSEIPEFQNVPNMQKVSMDEFLNRINNPKDLYK